MLVIVVVPQGHAKWSRTSRHFGCILEGAISPSCQNTHRLASQVRDSQIEFAITIEIGWNHVEWVLTNGVLPGCGKPDERRRPFPVGGSNEHSDCGNREHGGQPS